MKESGRIVGEALMIARECIKEGVSTKEIDRKIREYIEKCGAKPSFLGYGGFPASACISVNDEVIHGIPSDKKILCEGDIVKVDVGAFKGGFHGDAARTFGVGKISKEAADLIEVTQASFFEGLSRIKPDARLGDVGSAIQTHAEAHGFSVVRTYVGHGIGAALHESPDVPNYGTAGRGQRLVAGMAIAVEPMINAGGREVKVMDDEWTVKTVDGSLSAHYENTVVITPDCNILTTLTDADR